MIKRIILISILAIVFGNSVKAQVKGGRVTDVEGNSYETIIVGTQEWMASNLRTTKLSNGESIPNVTADTEWSKLATPAYCWYNNDASNKDTQGALYNWYVVNTQKICPVGWHVPTDGEWNILINYLGGSDLAGGKLKVKGTGSWLNPNTGASDEIGFTALASGNRYGFKIAPFLQMGYYCDWWSSTNFVGRTAWSRRLHFNSTLVSRNTHELRDGCSVRCIKDNQ